MSNFVSPLDSSSLPNVIPAMKKMNLKIVTDFPEETSCNDSETTPADMRKTPTPTPGSTRRRRSQPGTPDPTAEVVALTPEVLQAANRYICEVCHKGFQRDQNLQLHRRGHNLPWKLRQRSPKENKKKVYICPEPDCVHHHPSRALGDLTGIKKHYSRKHGKKKFKCSKCSKMYAVMSDCKAHMKVCGTKEYRCDCGTLFSRRDSFVTHRAFCESLNLQRLLNPNGTPREGTQTSPSPREALMSRTLTLDDMEEDLLSPNSAQLTPQRQPSDVANMKDVPANLESLILQAAMLIHQNKDALGTDATSLSNNLMLLGIDVNDISQLTLLVKVLQFLQQQQKQQNLSFSQIQQRATPQKHQNLFNHLFGNSESKPSPPQIIQEAPPPQKLHTFSPTSNANHQRTLSAISDLIAAFMTSPDASVKPSSTPGPFLERSMSVQTPLNHQPKLGSQGSLSSPFSSLVPKQEQFSVPSSPLGRVATQQLQELSRMSDQNILQQQFDTYGETYFSGAGKQPNASGVTRDFMGMNGLAFAGLAELLR